MSTSPAGAGAPLVLASATGSRFAVRVADVDVGVGVGESVLCDELAGGGPMDTAGADAVQGIGAVFVESVTGDPTAIVGLPLRSTVAALRAVGIGPPAFDR